MIRYHARWVVPVAQPPIEDATVAVQDERIAYVGQRSAAPRGTDVELGDAILLPGLVNAHTHLELTVMRGLLEGLAFPEWISTLVAARRAVLDDEALRDSARLGVTEGLHAGITTYADTCESGVVLGVMTEYGVRGIMYQEVFGPAPEQCDGAMAELRARMRVHAANATGLVRAGISPHAPYSVSDALFAAAARESQREGWPMAIHIAESEAESAFVERGAGAFADAHRARGIAVGVRAVSPVALLERAGALTPETLLIHCVRASADDVTRIAHGRAAVAHCPASNAKLGHGIAPLRELLDAGVRVGLGSDSMASNNRMDILGEARLASILQSARCGRSDAVSAQEALALATIGGARALGLGDAIGTLDVGKQADLAAFALDDARATPVSDPVTALVFAIAGGRARHVTVAGRDLVRDGKLVRDDPGLRARVQATADRLHRWKEGAAVERMSSDAATRASGVREEEPAASGSRGR